MKIEQARNYRPGRPKLIRFQFPTTVPQPLAKGCRCVVHSPSMRTVLYLFLYP